MNTATAFLLPFLLLLAYPATYPAGAQSPPPNNANPYPHPRFSTSMAIIIVVLIAALFFMGFLSIYIRHCSGSSDGAGIVRRALSLRARRAAAARGLDASIIESFPTFSYSEVKGHKIGKGTLECAVCLNEFEDDETLRLLPPCDHVFHPECIDAWLESHVTCPVCRANLSPTPTDEDNLQESSMESAPTPAPPSSGEVAVQMVVDIDRSESTTPAAAGRSWSIRMAKVSVLGGPQKFRSHSTGHSMVYPGENLERFTLRLPVQVRKEVMDRVSLNRSGSMAAAASLPRQGSSSRARFYRRIERGSRSSDRWGFSTRAMSMRLPKAAVEGGDGEGGSGRFLVKMPSFRCLEPKAADDETGLFSGNSVRQPV